MPDLAEPEIDVVALSPSNSCHDNSTSNEKKYFCQRCLNHDLQFPRKGHKPFCKYAQCNCGDCSMVEQRRQLNNMLSKEKVRGPPREIVNGRRIRDPQCARCGAHGVKVPLRGHKKVLCQFANCKCPLAINSLSSRFCALCVSGGTVALCYLNRTTAHKTIHQGCARKCELVESRRSLMAKQIKLRRDQQRQRSSTDDRQSTDSTGEVECSTESSSAEVSPSPPLDIPHPSPRFPPALSLGPLLPLPLLPQPNLLPISPPFPNTFTTPPLLFNPLLFLQLNQLQNH